MDHVMRHSFIVATGLAALVSLGGPAGCATTGPVRVETRTPAADPYASWVSGRVRHALDRARFAGRSVKLTTRVAYVPGGRLPGFTSLLPAEPSVAYAVVAGKDASALGSVCTSPSLLSLNVGALDGRPAQAMSVTQFAFIAGAERVGERLDPVIQAGAAGEILEVRPALAREGSLLVLDLRHDHVIRAGPDLAVLVHAGPVPPPEGAGVEATLPALVRSTVERRFVLRPDEVLALIRPAPERPGDALLTLVGWRHAAP